MGRMTSAPAIAGRLESRLRLSRSLIQLLDAVHYRHPGRWELMYRLAWRTLNENAQLLRDEADRDVRHAVQMERAVYPVRPQNARLRALPRNT